MNLKTTNIEFNVPTLHSTKVSTEFKSKFKSLIKLLNKAVNSSTDYQIFWSVREESINSSNTSIINFCDFCNVIAKHNYPKHKIKFEVNFTSFNPSYITVKLENKLNV